MSLTKTKTDNGKVKGKEAEAERLSNRLTDKKQVEMLVTSF